MASGISIAIKWIPVIAQDSTDMEFRAIPITLSLLMFMLSIGYSAQSASDYPIAGTAPWQRPEGAPVIEWVKHDRTWFEKSLTGVSLPYPRSLYFLGNQGNWYTPFTHQGMLPPYDLRGWH